MKRSFVVALVFTLALALSATAAFAGGFRVPEAGSKAMGLSNAFVGMADDPSAVQFNPAGITQLDGTQIYFGTTYIGTSNEYTDTGGTTTPAEEMTFFPPHFYYTNHLGDGDLWFGLGVAVPFGLGTEWDVASFELIVTDTLIEMVKINPAIGYRASENLSLAFGIDYYKIMEAKLENEALLPGPTPAYQEFEGDGDGYGFNFGLLYTASDMLSVGFAYRSGVSPDLEGDLTVTIDATGLPAPGFPTPGSADINLPATAALGISYKLSPRFTLNADLDWTAWSDYDELKLSVPALGPATVLPKDYSDEIAYRVGLEYDLNEAWNLRGGFLIESMPIPEETYDPRLPDGDRVGISIGAGYTKDAWTLDLAYMFVDFSDEDIDNDITDAYGQLQTVDGKYDGDINLFGVSLGYRF
ncbi:MAG: outer membrane protein transport protein [bacterium]|nr:MAG: outer membrane protein transport protein [bacterium]